MTNIKELTENLIVHLNRLKEKFEVGKIPEKDRDFFRYVKKETEPVFDMLDMWEEETIDWINQETSSVYQHQINATKDNMKALLLHSYYIDVRKRRYMEIYKSCHYIFNQLLKEING